MARKAKIDNAILKSVKLKENLKRKNKSLIPRKYFLIVCEGSKTEPNYFESYKKILPPKLLNVEICGTGCNTLQLVDIAIEKKEKQIKLGYNYDEIWLVFDKDSFPDDKFDNTIFKAKSQKINCAYSNEAFELWYLLHFAFYNTGMSRDQYKDKLSELLEMEYKKNDTKLFELLKDKQIEAIKNAKRLYDSSGYNHKSPSKENPSTTVFLLAEELNKYLYK